MNSSKIEALLKEAAGLDSKSVQGVRLNNIIDEIVEEVHEAFKYLIMNFFYKTVGTDGQKDIVRIMFPILSFTAGDKAPSANFADDIDWDAYFSLSISPGDPYALSESDWDAILSALPKATRQVVQQSLRKTNNSPMTLKQIGYQGIYSYTNEMLEKEGVAVRLEKQKRIAPDKLLTYRFKKMT